MAQAFFPPGSAKNFDLGMVLIEMPNIPHAKPNANILESSQFFCLQLNYVHFLTSMYCTLTDVHA